jgi:hypothetical protein
MIRLGRTDQNTIFNDLQTDTAVNVKVIQVFARYRETPG